MQRNVTRSSPPPIQTKAALTCLILVGLIAVIPFILPYHRLPLPHFYGEWVAFALGTAACFPFLSRNFWLTFKIPHLAFWLFGIIALVALQGLLINQVYIAQAVLPGIYIGWAAILIILSAWIREQLGLENSVKVLAWMITIGGTIHALIGLIQHFNVYGQFTPVIEMKHGVSIYGNIIQQNLFATQITLAGFSLIYLHATDQINHFLTIALLTLFALVLAASSSRSVAIYLVTGFVLTLVSYLVARTRIHRRLFLGSVILLMLFLVLQYLLPLLNDWLKLLIGALGLNGSDLDTLVMLQRNMAEGIDTRLSEWRKAWLMFIESPLWGIGIGNYGWYSFNYQALPEFSVVAISHYFHHSHNLIAQVLAELGIAGLFLLISAAVIWLRQVLPVWKNPSYWLILVLLIVLLLHSNVEFPLWYSFFLGLAAILLGLGVERAIWIKFTPWLGRYAAGAILFLSSVILTVTLYGFEDISHRYQAPSTSTAQQLSTKLHDIAKNPLLTPWAEAAIVLYGKPDRNILDQQLAMTNRVMRHSPNSINVDLQIIYLALTGRSIEAATLLQKAFIVYPSDFSKLACYWKATPVIEIERLWREADRLTGGSIKCQATGPS